MWLFEFGYWVYLVECIEESEAVQSADDDGATDGNLTLGIDSPFIDGMMRHCLLFPRVISGAHTSHSSPS